MMRMFDMPNNRSIMELSLHTVGLDCARFVGDSGRVDAFMGVFLCAFPSLWGRCWLGFGFISFAQPLTLSRGLAQADTASTNTVQGLGGGLKPLLKEAPMPKKSTHVSINPSEILSPIERIEAIHALLLMTSTLFDSNDYLLSKRHVSQLLAMQDDILKELREVVDG